MHVSLPQLRELLNPESLLQLNYINYQKFQNNRNCLGKFLYMIKETSDYIKILNQ